MAYYLRSVNDENKFFNPNHALMGSALVELRKAKLYSDSERKAIGIPPTNLKWVTSGAVMNNRSSILLYRAEEVGLQQVCERLQLALLPLAWHYEAGVMHFFYAGDESPTCDGNTAHHLEKIIQGMIA